MTSDLRPYLEAIDRELRAIVSPANQTAAPLYDMMAYHLGWVNEERNPTRTYQGKRLRPLLCLLSCQGAGGDWQRALPAAAALELVHNFSLIHDDIEDNSPTRRGRRTVWAVWGVAHGVNAGDAMLVIARGALARLMDVGVPQARVLAATRLLDRTCLRLCEGQYLDMAYEGRHDLSEEAYLEMIGAKTAALIGASAELGALIAGAMAKTEHYRAFGRHLGLAFQMIDDLLGIWGDPQTTGKPNASDIAERKMTLPIIVGLRESDQAATLAKLYGRKSRGTDVQRIVGILDRTAARDLVQRRAEHHQAKALAMLAAASPLRPAAQLLQDLAASLAVRER
jgi:geranylgeranyl diphosphate synthase type I